MGFFSLGRKKAPQISKPAFDQFGLGLSGMLKDVSASANQQRSMSNQLGSMLPGLFSEYSNAISNPNMGAYEQGLYNQAQGGFTQALRNAQLNAMNTAGNQFGGFKSALAGKGVSSSGAYAANVNAGLLAAQQANLNNLASDQNMKLMELRNTLTNATANRFAQKLAGAMSLQAQSDSQASQNLGTLLGVNASERGLQFNVDSYNANLKAMQKPGLNAFSLLGGMMAGGGQGAAAGSSFGPWGAAIGGGAGALGGLFGGLGGGN